MLNKRNAAIGLINTLAMAKVEGPLMSVSATGTFGGVITYVRARGQQVVRRLTIPSNPQTQGQAENRTLIRLTGMIISRVNLNQVGKSDGSTMTPLEYFLSIRVSPNTWNSEFNRRGFPSSGKTLTADLAAWDGLTQTEKDAWAPFNADFANPFEAFSGAPGDDREFVADFAGFSFARALARAGYLVSVPLDAPPAWDNSLKAMTRAERALYNPRRGRNKNFGRLPAAA